MAWPSSECVEPKVFKLSLCHMDETLSTSIKCIEKWPSFVCLAVICRKNCAFPWKVCHMCHLPCKHDSMPVYWIFPPCPSAIIFNIYEHWQLQFTLVHNIYCPKILRHVLLSADFLFQISYSSRWLCFPLNISQQVISSNYLHAIWWYTAFRFYLV